MTLGTPTSSRPSGASLTDPTSLMSRPELMKNASPSSRILLASASGTESTIVLSLGAYTLTCLAATLVALFICCVPIPMGTGKGSCYAPIADSVVNSDAILAVRSISGLTASVIAASSSGRSSIFPVSARQRRKRETLARIAS